MVSSKSDDYALLTYPVRHELQPEKPSLASFFTAVSKLAHPLLNKYLIDFGGEE
jgi:hypothetical protein